MQGYKISHDNALIYTRIRTGALVNVFIRAHVYCGALWARNSQEVCCWSRL